MTKTEIEALLDGTTPGPWKWARSINSPYLTPDVLLLARDGGGPDGIDPHDAENARLIAAAPDLARTALAALARAADAEAAVALVVEQAMPTDRAIQDLADHIWRVHPRELDEGGYVSKRFGGKYENPLAAWYADQIKALCRGAAIRAIAPASGVKALAEREQAAWEDGRKAGVIEAMNVASADRDRLAAPAAEGK